MKIVQVTVIYVNADCITKTNKLRAMKNERLELLKKSLLEVDQDLIREREKECC